MLHYLDVLYKRIEAMDLEITPTVIANGERLHSSCHAMGTLLCV